MAGLRILIADDHTLFREGLRTLLGSHADLEVVGEAATGEEAVRMAVELAPDVVLMDVQMPPLSGIEATRRIVAARPETAVVMVTMYRDDAFLFSAMRAGARGYVVKEAGSQEILRVLRAVGQGEVLFGPAVARRLLGFFRPRTVEDQARFPELTARELQILRLIARGHRNEEIAQALVLSPKTVRNHVASILAKLQVADRAQAVARARDAGLGQASPEG